MAVQLEGGCFRQYRGHSQRGVDLVRRVAVRMAGRHRPVRRDGVAQAVRLRRAPVYRQDRREVVLVRVALVPLAARA